MLLKRKKSLWLFSFRPAKGGVHQLGETCPGAACIYLAAPWHAGRLSSECGTAGSGQTVVSPTHLLAFQTLRITQVLPYANKSLYLLLYQWQSWSPSKGAQPLLSWFLHAREAWIKANYTVRLGMKKTTSIHKDKTRCKRHQVAIKNQRKQCTMPMQTRNVSWHTKKKTRKARQKDISTGNRCRIENNLNFRLSCLKAMYLCTKALKGWPLQTAGIHSSIWKTRLYWHKPQMEIKTQANGSVILPWPARPKLSLRHSSFQPVALLKGMEMPWGGSPTVAEVKLWKETPSLQCILCDLFYSWKAQKCECFPGTNSNAAVH